MSEPHRNRLANESSPYLQQHATNPVDWYPWGEEAFTAARRQDKPIFLSIGYATCHWCHVMERESFENAEVADLLNEKFINIKVDREELPQVDSLYMDFAQLMLGQGAGWPLNLVLNFDLKPIFAATYLPPYTSGEQVGLIETAQRISEVWESPERSEIEKQSEELIRALDQEDAYDFANGEEVAPTRHLIDSVAEIFYQLADPVHGGFQGAPKFPSGYHYSFMLDYAQRYDESRALFFVQKSLDHMWRGGIYDHLGGGFARYSVDEEWLIPHFEKMLYDNALLVDAHRALWQATGEPLHHRVAAETLDYVLREMTHRQGGFFAAEDADSEGEEGRYYTWGGEEILESLGAEDGVIFCDYYGVTEEGNFHGRNVLYVPHRLARFASERHLNPDELRPRLAGMRQRLLKLREKRPRPFKDDKVITAWNGLMMRAFAEAGFAFQEPKYVQAAVQCARFLRRFLWVDGRLHRSWRADRLGPIGTLPDYASLISGLLSLFRIGGRSEWLDWAMELSEVIYGRFTGPDEGACYETEEGDAHLIMRRRVLHDGAEPSGNAVHMENLMRLYQLTGVEGYRLQADEMAKAAAPWIAQQPMAGCYHLLAMLRYLDRGRLRLVIALNEEEDQRREIEQRLASRYLPHAEIVWRRESEEKLFELLPSLRNQGCEEGRTTLYVCKGEKCEAPLHDPLEIGRRIDAL